MKNLIKIVLSPRVATAIISTIGAIISAVCAGCRLAIGEMSVKDFSSEIFSSHSVTNSIN